MGGSNKPVGKILKAHLAEVTGVVLTSNSVITSSLEVNLKIWTQGQDPSSMVIREAESK